MNLNFFFEVLLHFFFAVGVRRRAVLVREPEGLRVGATTPFGSFGFGDVPLVEDFPSVERGRECPPEDRPAYGLNGTNRDPSGHSTLKSQKGQRGPGLAGQ